MTGTWQGAVAGALLTALIGCAGTSAAQAPTHRSARALDIDAGPSGDTTPDPLAPPETTGPAPMAPGVPVAAPDAKPASVDHPEGQVQEANPEGSAAVRVFHPGSSLLYGYVVLNAQPESAKQNQLEVQTRLFRDGKQIYTGKPNTMEVAAQPDPKRLVAGGTMKLGKVEPGDYILQVLVTDKLAREKYRTATSYMDFEVK